MRPLSVAKGWHSCCRGLSITATDLDVISERGQYVYQNNRAYMEKESLRLPTYNIVTNNFDDYVFHQNYSM